MYKKSVLGLFILGIVIFSIVTVNAGWWSKLTGKAQQAQANVNVQYAQVPPNVTYVSKPYLPLVGGDYVDPVAGLPYFVNFTFAATTKAGTSDCVVANLPGGATPAQGTIVTSYVISNFSLGGVSRPIAICRYWNDFQSSWAGQINDCWQRNYTCMTQMWYYDDALINWTISVVIADIDNRQSAVNKTQTFMISRLANFVIVGSTAINWTNPPLQLGAADQYSNYDLRINNTGNVNFTLNGNSLFGTSTLIINATRLNGTQAGFRDKFIVPK